MKSKLLLSILATVTLNSSAWADDAPVPEKCPSPSIIQQVPFLGAQQGNDGTYAAIQVASYDTTQAWVFLVAGIEADSKHDALSKAKASLTTLSLDSGPTYSKRHGKWSCIYNNSADTNYFIVAMTPLDDQTVNSPAIFQALPMELKARK